MATISKGCVYVALAGTLLLLGGNAHARAPADKCESAKLKRAGQYNACARSAADPRPIHASLTTSSNGAGLSKPFRHRDAITASS